MKNEHKKLCSLVTNEKINNAWLAIRLAQTAAYAYII